MLVRKISRGLYEVIDPLQNNYRVEDSRRVGAFDRPNDSSVPHQRWGIWEQANGKWDQLDSNSTLHECLKVITVWCAASEIGK
jgi:hypothetical protein